ncbi:MAG: DUF433 domain-containing protein [Thermohalobaculum sp.]
MPAASQMVSANEAAALAMVEVRDVHRAFDEHLLPEALLGGAGASRQVARGAVPLLAFYFRTAGILQADARKAVIRLVAGNGRTGALRRVAALRRRRDPLPMGDGISADLRPFIAEADARARLLEQARAMAVLDPDMLGGSEPVVRGTRVPVRDVAAAVVAGLSVAEILASYPSLTAEQVELAALYASVERPRGKPRRPLAERLPAGARVIASGTVPRRAAPAA